MSTLSSIKRINPAILIFAVAIGFAINLTLQLTFKDKMIVVALSIFLLAITAALETKRIVEQEKLEEEAWRRRLFN